jgi:hypothetical protein
MNTDALLSALLGGLPACITSLVTFHMMRKSNQSLEKTKTKFQQDLLQFTKWHEKRIEALISIYEAFCDYLDFLRRALYVRHAGMNMDPMHEFRNKIERQMLYLDDAMAQKISQYQGELLVFWNTAMTSLSTEGESARGKIQQQLDFEIPAYLPRLQEDINRCLDPNFTSDDKTYRRLIAEWQSNPKHRKAS